MFHTAHVIAESSRGLPLAIMISLPPVPSRRQLSRQYHVANPVRTPILADGFDKVVKAGVEFVVPPHCSQQFPMFAVSTAAQQVKQISVGNFIGHFSSLLSLGRLLYQSRRVEMPHGLVKAVAVELAYLAQRLLPLFIIPEHVGNLFAVQVVFLDVFFNFAHYSILHPGFRRGRRPDTGARWKAQSGEDCGRRAGPVCFWFLLLVFISRFPFRD
jgi:hypothetical protein